MDVGLHGAFGSAGRRGDLGVRQPVDVTQDDGCPLGGAQAAEEAGPGLAIVPPSKRIRGRLGAWIEDQLGRRNPPDPGSVAGRVEQDRGQPAADPELPDSLGRPGGQGPVGADEGVLDQLLGLGPIAAGPERDREQPVLVDEDHGLEGCVKVDGERMGERGVVGSAVIHHVNETPLARGRLHHPRATIPDMGREDRFEELAAAVGGFYRSWVVYLGLDLGLFGRIRSAGAAGLTAAELAAAAGCRPEPIAAWVRAAHAGDLLELVAGRATVGDDIADILLDDTHPAYLGGQFVVAVVSSLDYAGLADFVRGGPAVVERPPRFHRAIEAVTVQDITVFFQEGLAELPDLAAALNRGGRILDVACGGGKWLIAVARRFTSTSLVGVEFEPDSVERAQRHVDEAGLGDRIRIESRTIPDMPFRGEFDLAYLQDALHELPDLAGSLRAAWAAVAPGGRLVVLEWCLPDEPGDMSEPPSLQAELLWGIQIDELYQGTRMFTRDGYLALFAEAGAPAPTVVDLRSGASLFVVDRPA